MSTAYNEKANDYHSAFHRAIRKYGIGKFTFEVLEEIDDQDGDLLDEREIFFIQHFQSLVTQNGYNISLGGDHGRRVPLTYEEKLQKSKLFSAADLQDIQNMLRQECSFEEIMNKYPKLKRSFLSNINIGLAFNNPKWAYPLQKVWRSRLTKGEMAEIRNMIKNPDIPYKDIAEKFGIKSQGFISMINTGKFCKDPSETYPLRVSKHGRTMAAEAQHLLIFGDWSHCSSKSAAYREIAPLCGYNQTGSVKKIDLGLTHKNKNLLYPLLNHQKENQLLLK